jgi:hypothetical protein
MAPRHLGGAYCIRRARHPDLKEGAGMDHVPSGGFSANSAWLRCAVPADNLIRWTASLSQAGPSTA